MEMEDEDYGGGIDPQIEELAQRLRATGVWVEVTPLGNLAAGPQGVHLWVDSREGEWRLEITGPSGPVIYTTGGWGQCPTVRVLQTAQDLDDAQAATACHYLRLLGLRDHEGPVFRAARPCQPWGDYVPEAEPII
jgi:hypothetical protein